MELNKNGERKFKSMIEINKTFMYNGLEYRIIFINEKVGTFSVEQINQKLEIHEVGSIIKIDEKPYKVFYVNYGKGRITLKPIGEER